MLDFNTQVKPYLMVTGDTPSLELAHPFYNDSIAYKKKIQELKGLKYPYFMSITRPRESDAQKKYREDIYDNPVKVAFEIIFDYVRSIPNNSDYKVKYADEKGNVEDSFKNYVQENFNREGDLDSWFWENGINAVMDDPNSVMIMIPKEVSDQSKLRGVTGKFLGCEHVWMHQNQEFAVILSDERSQLTGQKYEKDFTGKILYFFDHESYTVATQLSDSTQQDKTLKWEVLGMQTFEDGLTTFNPPLHYCGGLPVRKLGKRLEKSLYSNKYQLFKHELDSVFTYIKATIRRFNDIEVENNTSLYTLNWRLEVDCNNCEGKGEKKVFDANGEYTMTTCKKCNGSGQTGMNSSMDTLGVKQLSFDEWTKGKSFGVQAPGGSVQNTPINLQAQRSEFNENFCAIFHNMGLSSLLPIHFAQSGTAKREDKEGAIRFGVEWSNHFCQKLLSWSYWCTASMRYGISGKQLALMPEISQPRTFNLDTKEEVSNQLMTAISNKMDAGVIDTLQLKYIKLEASEDSEAYRRYELRMQLDGYRGVDAESKYFIISNEFALGERGSATFDKKIKSLYFSINFDKIYQDAILENIDFHSKTINEKRKIMEEISDNYTSILPTDKPLESFNQRSAVNIQDRNQLSNN
jgi:hypothetical protein